LSRKDFVSVGIPKGLCDEIDKYLKTDEAKKFGYTSRPEVIAQIIRHWLIMNELRAKGKPLTLTVLDPEYFRELQKDANEKSPL